MKCLVTGATGFVGRPLCEALLRRNEEVVALGRQGNALEGLSLHRCDLTDSALPASYLQGVDVVFHLAAIAHRHSVASQYDKLNHLATLRLARQAEAAGVRSFVFVSSVRAMGEPADDSRRAEGDVCPTDDLYSVSKWRAECALREAFSESPMAVLIVRPTVLFGAGVKGNLQMLSRASLMGLPRPPDGGRRSMLAVDDLVALLCMLAEPTVRGVHTWIASGPDYSTRELYHYFRQFAGRGQGHSWLPLWAWRTGCALLDAVSGSAGSFDKLFGTDLYDSSLAQAELSWQPRQTFAASLREQRSQA